jgi:cytochrome c oxidase subunit 2
MKNLKTMTRLKSALAAVALVAAPAILFAQNPAPPSALANPASIQIAPGNGGPAPAIVSDAPQGAAATTPPATPVPAPGPAIGQASANVPASNDPAAAPIPQTLPTPGIGLPDGRIHLQDQVTEVGQDAAWMHDIVLMPIITLICLFVLALLLWVVFRFRSSANPIPSRTSHNTMLEVFWTLAPVAILLIIAVPSIRLLAKQYAPPKADLTVKVIGNQWYWTYQYPDNGDFELVSNMLKEPGQQPTGGRARSDADGPRLLAVDERMVVPAGAVVKLIITSADVLHSFRRARLLDQDGRGAGPPERDLVQGRSSRASIMASVRSCAARGTPICRSRSRSCRGRSSPPGSPRRAAPCRVRRQPTTLTPPGAATSAVGAAPKPVDASTTSAVGGIGAGSDPVINSTVTAQPIAQGATNNQGSQTQ